VDKTDHYLITRFNVPVPNWARDKAGITTLDEAWMNHRITLFNTFCAPSVAGQTLKDFRWLIYCDRNTAKEFVDQINQSILMIPHAELRFVKDFDELKVDLKQVISTGGNQYIITSRVDNDDALGRKYIELTQVNLIHENRMVINLCGGALYDLHQRILTKLPQMRFNHFGSLVEKRNDTVEYLTVMGFSHHDPPADVKVKDVKSEYAWLKIIHDRNVNSRTIGVPVFSSDLAQHFNLEKNVLPVSLLRSIVYFFKRSLFVLKRKAKG